MGFLDGFDLPGEDDGGQYVIKETLAKYASLGAYDKYIIIDPHNKEFTFHRQFLWGLFGRHDVLKFDELKYIKYDYQQKVHRDDDGRRHREDVYQVCIVSQTWYEYPIWTFNNSNKSRAFVNTLQHYTGLSMS